MIMQGCTVRDDLGRLWKVVDHIGSATDNALHIQNVLESEDGTTRRTVLSHEVTIVRIPMTAQP